MAAELAPVSTEPAARGRRLGLGGFEVGVVAVAVTAAIAGTAAAQGGYFATSWGWAALAFGFAALLAVILRERIELSRVEIVYLGLVAAFVGWIALSISWSIGVSGTVQEVERVMVYATGSLAFLLLARRGQIRVLLGAILVGLFGITAYSLIGRLFPTTLFSSDFGGYRLFAPVGYWNGLGILCAIAALLALGFVVEGTRAVTRALAAAALPLLATTLYFTFGRGAWVALALATIFTIAVSPLRVRFVTTIFVLAPATVIALWLARGSHALTHRGTSLAATLHDGHRLAVWLLVLAGLSAGCGLALHFAERHVQFSPVVRKAYATALVAALVGLIIFGLVAGGGPARIVRHSYDRFTANPLGDSNLNRRLFQLSSNGRVALWHVAWREFARHPITGTGAGTYEPYWYEHRGTSTQVVRDAHSLYIETLGELGIPGAALLLGTVLVPFAGLSVRRRPHVAIALGAYTCLLVHAITDWDWELPAVMLAGTWCGLATLVERRGSGQTARVGIRGRSLLAVAAFVLTAFAFVGLVGNLAVSSGWDALRAGNLSKSRHEARRAAGWAPWASDPWLLLAQTELAHGDQPAARGALREAIDRQPRDFTLWQQLALVTRGPEHRQALLRARQLNPGSTAP